MFLLLLNRTLLTIANRFGPLAFIGLGLADNSVIPIPGSMDALAIVLAASNRELWWYYALIATGGSVLGGYVTYRIARKEGKQEIEKKLGKTRSEKAYRYFGQMGFWSVFVGGIAPPPVPTVAFIMTAGALQYSRHRFLLALSSARLVRFMAITWIASRYGSQIFQFFSKYYEPALWSLIGLAIAGALAGLGYYLWWRKRKQTQESKNHVPERKAA